MNLKMLLFSTSAEVLLSKGSNRHLLEKVDSKKEVHRATAWGYVIVAVFFTINLVQLVSYSHLRQHPAIAKRRPLLVILSGVFTLLFLFMVCINLCFAQDDRWPVYKNHKRAVCPVFFLLQLFESTAHMIIAYRIHLIWFDLGMASAMEGFQWQLHLDDASERDNFYLKYRRTLGNKLYTRVYAIFWAVTFSVLGALAVALRGYKFTKLSRTFIGINLWLPMAHLCVTCLLLPRFQDLWHVREEVYVTVIPSVSIALVWFIYAICFEPHPPTEEYSLWSTFGCTSHFLAICAQTTWVQWSNGLPLTPWKTKVYKKQAANGERIDVESRLPTAASSARESSPAVASSIELLSTAPRLEDSPDTPSAPQFPAVAIELVATIRPSDSPSISSIPMTRPRSLTAERIEAVLFDERGLLLLWKHMTRELSSESILFLTETEQFLGFMKQRFADELRGVEAPLRVAFASTAPTSRVVEDSDDVYETACRLFLKYLRISDPLFDVSLTHVCRHELNALFSFVGGAFVDDSDSTLNTKLASEWLSDKLTFAQLFHVFDGPRHDVYTLVRQSFSRFVRTDVYEQWLTARNEALTEEIVETMLS